LFLAVVLIFASRAFASKARMAVAEEESMDEQDKGTLTYQESKVFHAEPHLCSVYENTKRRLYTFEVYGLDTQETLHKQYTYNDFDGLFRFNAELMNPNRKEGRYHWVIERLEIGQVGQEKKLRLANEVTKEVPELPIYETNRKIPTGRMDLKERQRLRETMDMLHIKRDENIRKKREVSKAKFLEHIKFLKEEHKRKEEEQERALAKEREERVLWQMDMEKEEEDQAAQIAVVTRKRRIAAETKDQKHEEAEEEDLRQLRIRWRAADAEKAKLMREARERKAKQDKQKAEEAKEEAARLRAVQAKRSQNWANRDKRVKKKQDDLVKRALDLLPELKRLANLKIERNAESLQEWNDRRWPIFHGVLERIEERKLEAEREADRVQKYIADRSIPPKEKVKGKHKKAKATAKRGSADKLQPGKQDHASDKKRPPSGKKKGEPGKSDTEDNQTDQEGHTGKQEADRIVDGVEAKMRAELDEMNRRKAVDQKREVKIREKEDKRKQVELQRIMDYKRKVADAEGKRIHDANERHLIQKEKEEEKRQTEERQKEEDKRLENHRARGVLAMEQKQIEYLCSH